eukprot:c27555_g1_i3 orf=815-1642(+)
MESLKHFLKADKILKDAGVDTTPVVEAAKSAAVIIGEAVGKTTKVLEDAKPIVSDSFESIVAADPLVLIGSAGVLILLYSIAPSVLSSVVYAARGYKGDLSAPQALDLLTRENYLLVDVRREREKSKSGVPSLPCNTRNKLLSLSVEELPGKLKSQLRDAKKVEAELAAVKISYLKKVNKGSRLVILDAYGDIAKTIARSLTRLGFKNTWVISSGFDGGKGWVQSCLGTDSYKTSITEIVSPSRIIPADTTRLLRKTSSNVARQFTRLPPGGSDK